MLTETQTLNCQQFNLFCDRTFCSNNQIFVFSSVWRHLPNDELYNCNPHGAQIICVPTTYAVLRTNFRESVEQS